MGEHLHAVRQDRKLLQRDVAALLSVSVETIHNWECGRTSPLPQDGLAIVRFLGYLPLPTATLPERLYALRFANG